MTIERSQERVDATGEVFTPRDLVDDMLDKLPADTWLDPTKKWLEPTCGDGNILVVILERLMMSLQGWEPDDQRRHQHIVENMLFGVDFMEDNAEECVTRLNASHLNHNIVCVDGMTYDYQFGRTSFDETGLWEQPAQKLFKKHGKNAWYVTKPG